MCTNGVSIYSTLEGREGPNLGCHMPGHLGSIPPRLAVREAGVAADDAAFRKTQIYSNLISSHYFVPLAVESLGVFGKDSKEAQSFLKELGQRVKSSSGDPMTH